MPTTRSSSWMRSWRCLPRARPWTSRGSPTMSPTVCRGSSEAKGSWKIIAISRRIRRMPPLESLVSSWPLNLTEPADGSRRRTIVRPSVDLPQPDSPTRPRVSPCLISRSTPSTARTQATVRWRTPAVTGKYFLRPRTSTSGSAEVQALLSLAAVAVSGIQVLSGLGHPAGGELRLADRLQGRRLLGAALDPEGAAGMKGASARRADQVRRQTLDRLERLPVVVVQARDGAQQGPRVGMLGAGEDVVGRARLHDLARVHHQHALAHVGFNAQAAAEIYTLSLHIAHLGWEII